MARYSETDVKESIKRLRKICPPGTTVYTVLRHVSRSGMMREISLYVIRKGELRSITWDAARALKNPINRGHSFWALRVSGAGMDMGFHVVNSLSYALHGYKSKGDGAAPDAQGIPFHKTRPGHYRAGYSLNQRWM